MPEPIPTAQMTEAQEALIPEGKSVFMNSPTDSREQDYRCAQDGTDIEHCTCGFREALAAAAIEFKVRVGVQERRSDRKPERGADAP